MRQLQNNPVFAEACGIHSTSEVPSKYAYCRFLKKLACFNDVVQDVLTKAVNQLRERSPSFGETVAVDATDVKAWANGLHPQTDPDARTGAKQKSSRRIFWFGYKVHLAVDAGTELPVWFHLTPANAHDGKHLSSVMDAARQRFPWLQPKYVLADKGYDSRECFRYVGEELHATPVIDVRQYHSRRLNDSRACEAYPIITPQGVRYRCERTPFSPKCPRFGKCPLLPLFVNTANEPTEPTYYERYTNLPHGSREWKLVYNKRVAVERAFSRLKGFRKLNGLRVRRLAKVWLHTALSIVVAVVLGLVRFGSGSSRVVAA